MEFVSTLEEAAEVIRPTAVIGVSGVPGSFTEKLLREMAEHHPHPIVFALSNPTAKSECTASQAYEWTGGRAIFASGSPFPPVDYQGKTFVPGQANNAYIFPGVGLGAIVSNSNRVTDEMFFIAARELASMVSEHDLGLGRLFPSLSRIREVSARIAVSVAAHAFERGYAQAPEPDDLVQTVQDFMFVPEYASFA